MKSMISNRTKGEYGRVSVSMSELEVKAILNGRISKLKIHLEECLLKLESFDGYSSAIIKDKT